MHAHGFQGPDGQIWELIHMDASSVNQDWAQECADGAVMNDGIECYSTLSTITDPGRHAALFGALPGGGNRRPFRDPKKFSAAMSGPRAVIRP